MTDEELVDRFWTHRAAIIAEARKDPEMRRKDSDLRQLIYQERAAVRLVREALAAQPRGPMTRERAEQIAWSHFATHNVPPEEPGGEWTKKVRSETVDAILAACAEATALDAYHKTEKGC